MEKLYKISVRESLKEKFASSTELINSIETKSQLYQQVFVSDRSKCLFIEFNTL